MELLQVSVEDNTYSIKENPGAIKEQLKKQDTNSATYKFFTALALCHTVVLQPASEPDETEQDPHQRQNHEKNNSDEKTRHRQQHDKKAKSHAIIQMTEEKSGDSSIIQNYS